MVCATPDPSLRHRRAITNVGGAIPDLVRIYPRHLVVDQDSGQDQV